MQRKSRLDAVRFVDLLMFSSQHLDQVSLEDLANDFGEKHGLSISKQALQERFNEQAVNFLMELLNRQLKSQLPGLPIDKRIDYARFSSIKVKDSTRFELPASYACAYKGHGGVSSPAQISIQYEYDLLTGKPVVLQLTSACRNDQQDSKQTLQDIGKGELLIRDMAYVSQAYLTHITTVGAYYLNRLNPKWIVHDKDDKPIDFGKLRAKIDRHNLPVTEVEGFIRMGKNRLRTRLIVSRVPDKVYQDRIYHADRAAKSKGYNLTQEYKTRASLNLFITNIPKEWIETEHIRRTYSLRWQIELVFKAWKSQASIDKMKAFKLHRFQCQLIARFLWLLIHTQVRQLIDQWTSSDSAFQSSTQKFFKTAFRLSHLLREVLFYNSVLSMWMERMLLDLGRKYFTETRKHRPNVSAAISQICHSLA